MKTTIRYALTWVFLGACGAAFVYGARARAAPQASDFACVRAEPLDRYDIEFWICGRFGRV